MGNWFGSILPNNDLRTRYHLNTMLAKPKNIFLATGGFGHFLVSLESTLLDASVRHLGPVGVMSSHHAPLARLAFDDIFELRSGLPPVAYCVEPYLHRRDVDLEAWAPRYSHAKGQYCSNGGRVRSKLRRSPRHGLDRVTVGQASANFLPNTLFEHFSLSRMLLREVGKVEDGSQYIGAHFRNTDYASDPALMANEIASVSNSTGINQVRLCTDNWNSFKPEAMRLQSLGIQIEVMTPNFNTRVGAKNLHYGVEGGDALAMLAATIRDLITLAESSVYVPTPNARSTWNELIPWLRKKGWANVFE